MKRTWGPDPNDRDVKELIPLAEALRNNVRMREKREGARRVSMFRGAAMVKAIISSTNKRLADTTTEADAVELGRRLLASRFIHQVSKIPNNDKHVQPINFAAAKFSSSKDDYFVWDYEGSKTRTYIMLGLMITVALAVCLFPVWPNSLRLGAWYCSVTLLLFMIAFVIIRSTLFLCLWLAGYSFWILPNVFDDDLPFFDSFKPGYSFEASGPGNGFMRVLVVACIAGMGYFVATQPTEFDHFIIAQRQFVDDLYSGSLLSDSSQEHKDTLDDIKAKFDAELNSADYGEEDEEGEDGDEDLGVDPDAIRGADVHPYGEYEEHEVDDDEIMKELLEEVKSNAAEDEE